MKNKYRFYRVWVQVIKELPTNQDRLNVINAISDYLLYGKETVFEKPSVQSAWESIKQSDEFRKEVGKK